MKYQTKEEEILATEERQTPTITVDPRLPRLLQGEGHRRIVTKIAVDQMTVFVRVPGQGSLLEEDVLLVGEEVRIILLMTIEVSQWMGQEDHPLHPARGLRTRTGIVDPHEAETSL